MDVIDTVSQLLQAASAGDDAARERLWSTLYLELHRIAAQQMATEAPGQTLQPTALIHELYLRLFTGQDFESENTQHFFAVAAKVMRQIRVDAARHRKRLKRGGSASREELADQAPAFDEDPTEVLAINEVLERLGQHDSRKAEIVELRYFAGLSIDECAAALGVSARTIDNEWRFARAWLHRQLTVDAVTSDG